MFGLGPKVPSVSAEELKSEIDNKKDFSIIDVRTPGEFEKTRIEGSINIPLDQIDTDIEKYIKNKNQTIYAYCLSGSRSVHAVDMLIKLGYINTFDVTSGLLAWRAKQYPLVS